MRVLSTLLAGAAVLSAASPAVAGRDNGKAEARLAKALAGRVAGTPTDCIRLSEIESSEIIDRTAILYRTVGGRFYLNRPTIGADSLDSDDVLVTRTIGAQLCSIDTVRLIDRTSWFAQGFVSLGEFVPYTKPRPAD